MLAGREWKKEKKEIKKKGKEMKKKGKKEKVWIERLEEKKVEIKLKKN